MMSDEMVGGVHVFARLIVIVEESLASLDISLGVEEDSGLAIDLAAHSAHILLLSLRANLAVVDAIEEASDIGEDVRDNYET